MVRWLTFTLAGLVVAVSSRWAQASLIEVVGRVGGTSYAVAVAPDGQLAYVGIGGTLQVLDVSTPWSATQVGQVCLPAVVHGAVLSGNHVYIADNEAGLQVVDVSDPANPIRVGICGVGGHAIGIAVRDSYAYLAASEAGLQIVDISDPTNPLPVASLPTRWRTCDVALGGSYAYVADDGAGLEVVDVSNPLAPVQAGSCDTPGYAYGVAVAGSYAYVGDWNAGLQVIDISNPAAPTVVGGCSTPDMARSVIISGHNAYVTEGFGGLQIIDVSNPLSPMHVARYDTPGDARGLALCGSLVYVADFDMGLFIIDVSQPSRPFQAGAYYKGKVNRVQDVAVCGTVAYLACGREYQRIDVTDPTAPVVVGGGGKGAWSVAAAGSHVYLASGWDGLQVVDGGRYDTPGDSRDVALSGQYAYVADYDQGLQVVRIWDPYYPARAGTFITGGLARGVAVVEPYAYVANEHSDLQIINVSDPARPVRMGTCGLPGNALTVAVCGAYAYVAADPAGLQILNVSNPASPTVVGSYQTPGYAYGVAASGRYAYVAALTDGLQVVDVSNPAAPVLVGGCDTPGAARNVVVQGSYAYVADDDGGLIILRVPATQARTLYVDGTAPAGGDGLTWKTAKKTIQAAVDAAEAGDQVWVRTGTYVENIMLKEGVSLYGGFAGGETELGQRDWVVNVTTLDGNRAGSVVTAPAGATCGTRIDGFTITNGTGTLLSNYTRGGGLYLNASSPTVINNTIVGNSAEIGGGLYLSGSRSTIANNKITGNTASSGGGLHAVGTPPTIISNKITGNAANSGGGLFLNWCSAAATNNTITNNSAYSAGGGLYAIGSSPAIVSDTIMGNTAQTGAGVWLMDCSATITNNAVTGNSASAKGGGLYLLRSTPRIVNNTITGNSASTDGGGLYLDFLCSPIIANAIIALNSSGVYRLGTTGTPTLRCNCVYGNTTYNYSGLTDPIGTNGNISADPKMIRGGHLQSGSPCIDVGDQVYGALAGGTDMDGEARMFGSRIDIGSDEFTDMDGNGLPDWWKPWYDPRFDVDVRFPPPPTGEVLMSAAASGPSPAQWRYTLSDPGVGWTAEAFNDSSWQIGTAGFGEFDPADPLDAYVTLWPTSQIWLRRTFVLDDANAPMVLWGRWDDAVSVYINGVAAFAQNNWVDTYQYSPISDQALASLRSGVNVIAVNVVDYGGGRYVDMGLALNPMTNMPVSGYEVNPALEAIHAAALQYFERNIIPAATVAVMKKDRIVLKRGYGYMDKYRTRAVPPEAIFRLASLDKTPGFAAARRLIDAGFVDPVTGVALTLDTPVFPLFEPRGLAPIPDHTPDPRVNQITIQHIIEHRTGLCDVSWPGDMLAQTGVPFDQYSPIDNVRYVYSHPLAFAPGSTSVYCNSAPGILRHLIDLLTGSFESYFSSVVMAGYSSQGMAIAHEALARRDPLEPWYQTFEMPYQREIQLDYGFGLTSSAEVYARFCRGYNLWTGQRMINPATGAWTPVPDNGWTYFLGGMSGTRTEAIQRRWDEVTIVVLTNSNADVSPLGTQLYDIVDTLPPDAWKQTGDVNGDGYVNVGDLQALVAAWGSQAGPPASSNWNAAADINSDGYVNVGDLQALVANWGRSL